MIESQFGILVEKISTTRDYEAARLAHDHFLSALLAQSFVHMKTVRNRICFLFCLYENSFYRYCLCFVFTTYAVRVKLTRLFRF